MPVLEGVFDDFFAKNGHPSRGILKWAGEGGVKAYQGGYLG